MSARWLLDVAALSKGAQAVLRSHLALRGQQASLIVKTSPSITVLTGQDRRAEGRPRNQDGSNGQAPQSYVPDAYSTEPASSRESRAADLNDENFYDPAEGLKAGGGSVSAQSFPVQQHVARNPPLRDGSFTDPSVRQSRSPLAFETDAQGSSPANLGGATKDDDSPIPRKVATHAPADATAAGTAGSPETFNSPLSTTTCVSPPETSNSQIPSEAAPASPPVVEGNINSNVFYTPPNGPSLPGSRVVNGESQKTTKPVSGDDLENLFQNQRIGRQILDHAPINSHDKNNQGAAPQWPPKDRYVEIPQETLRPFKNQSGNAAVAADKSESVPNHGESLKHDAEPTSASPSKSQVSSMRESRVPSSRFGRVWEYAGLGASMTLGAAAESFRRMTGSREEMSGPAMLSAANIERLVAKLSRMRGAALKIGQLLSFQDSNFLPPTIQLLLQRVQDSADYMPAWQRNKVLESNLGPQWRDHFESFDEQPIAAASIGQVHGAILKSNSKPVVVKIQYPGVASSIDSDLDNLSLLLHASRLLPKGLYLDKTIANARTELGWECDYEREAGAAKKFRQFLTDETEVFRVPEMYDHASGPQVLTMERMSGIAVTKITNLTQEQKDWIGSNILRLCLREIAEFRYMQTDPNWTNFLFNQYTNKLELLDFGASREYPKSFIDLYTQLLLAASEDNHEACRELSIQLGYLTGMESKAMCDAHIKSLLTLAEPFKTSAPDVYDFRDQTITDRVREFIPIMLRERLSPPPEETYSLHRKLSGAFLLLARLGSRVDTKTMFADAMQKSGAANRRARDL